MPNIQRGLESIADMVMEQSGGPSKLQQFKDKFGGFAKGLNSKMGGMGAMAGDLVSGLGSAIGNKYGEDFNDQQRATQSAIRQGLAMIPGYGQIIAAATGAVDAIGTATGLNLSNIDKNSANRAGLGGAASFNNAMNSLPGNSMI